MAAVERPKKTARVTADDSASIDPNAIRTLIVTGLPSDLTKAVLWKKIRKVNAKAEVEYPVEGEANTANVVFPTHGDAVKAVSKLHGHVYKGSLLSAVLKKRAEKLSSKGEGAVSHAGRLIVRNLAWETTEADLRATFLPFGPIVSIDLPTAPSKLPNAPPRARGFAFVWFMVKKDAERAMAAINGKPIKRALDAGVAKGKAGRLAKKATETLGDGRPVAVDWALSKDKWDKTQNTEEKKEESKPEDAGNITDSDSESGSSSGSDSDSDSGSDDSDEEDEEEEEGDISMADAEAAEAAESDTPSGSDDEEDEEEPVKPSLPSTDVGATVFVRNLPFEATEQELGQLFHGFGPIRYARITMDRATGRSRGTGFVCFWNTEHADSAIKEAERVARETGANAMPLGEKKNPFALPSVLQADPSAQLASKLVLHGRTLAVSRAVTREQASNLKEDAERAREKGDKRNTYLMREGVVFPNSPAAASMPPAEVERRQAAFGARKALLRSNPALYISKTRLSVRQLPLFVTDRGLKRLAIHAVRAFDDEVKEGVREGLARHEEADDTMSAALEGRSKKRGERQTAVVQSKVVRSAEKPDPVTGSGRSRGYGFLELRSHRDALKVLRWANNNAQVGKLLWSWWTEELKDLKERAEKQAKDKPENEDVKARLKKINERIAEGDDRAAPLRGGKTLLIEFSVENAQVVKRRSDRQKNPKRPAADSDDEGQQASPAKRPRTEKRDGAREDRKERKERKSPKKPRGNMNKGPRDEKKRSSASTSAKAEITGKPADDKLGSKLGSMIGRKRKMRKGGK